MKCTRSTFRVVLGLLAASLMLAVGGCSTVRSLVENKPQAPKVAPDNTLAVLYFRPKGDVDARYYAASFARALSDRLYCSPDHQINQPTAIAVGEHLYALKKSSRGLISDETAVEVGKRLGVRYVVSGDLVLKGEGAEISTHLFDLQDEAPKPVIVKASGKLADLAEMQTTLAEGILKGMDVQPEEALTGLFAKPSFTETASLLAYGQSFFEDDLKSILRLRWKAVKEDPDSPFAVARLLGTYVYGDAAYRDIVADKELPSLVDDALVRFAGHPEIGALIGWIYIQEYQYKKAEAHLRRVVQRFPGYAYGHDALAHIAMCRDDAELAVDEGVKLVEIWPTSARAHIVLADAYSSAASAARRGHFYNDMTTAVRSRWHRNCRLAYREACIAVELNPRASYAWQTMMEESLQLGYRDYIRRAFDELVKINPNNYDAYSGYATSLVDQWGGTAQQREELYERVDEVFGKDSVQSCLIRGYTMICNLEHDADRPEILRLADKAWEKSKGTNLSALNLKCRVLIGLRRRDEMLQVARQGFALDPSPNWQMLVARGNCFRWEDKADRKALQEAHDLLRVYVHELPNDTQGHNNLGWCLSHMGRREEAKREFLKTLELDPTNEIAREKMAYVQ